jgi:nucleotide-binding universal stress UspA family protein
MHIMVATDGSEGGDRAVDMAAALAKAAAATLLVITVANSEFAHREGIDELAQAEGGFGEAVEFAANAILQRGKKRARLQGAVSVEVQHCWGDPAEAIMEMAQSKRTDLIVVGRRGRGRLAGLLLGSVSQKLVSLAPCAVTVVP